MGSDKGRKSSIELLRIISMIMVIAYHWQLHGNNDGIISSLISVKQIFSFFWGSWGSLGVDIFFIISAFFLVKSSTVKVSRVLPIILKVSFYGVAVLLILNICSWVDFDIIETIKSTLGVFAYQYWFLTVYVVIYFFHPALNMIIEAASKKYLLWMMAVAFYSSYIIGFVFVYEFVGRLACGLTIYLLIGFLEKYPQYNIFKRYSFLISVWGGIAVVILECVCSFLGMRFNTLFYSIINRIQITQSPLMLIIACGIFYSALKCNISQSKIINFLGRYSAGAYLLHGGSSVIKGILWDGILKVSYFYNECNTSIYIIYYVTCTILFFLVGCIIEYIVNTVIINVTCILPCNRKEISA